MYRLHCFAQSGNSYKVALMLELCGLPWEPVLVEFFKGETRSPAYREGVNLMGEAPVLERDGRRLSQSGAILQRLAKVTGRFAARTEDEEDECWRWILFDNHKLTSYFATHRFLRCFAKDPDGHVVAWLKGRADAALSIAERRLAASPYLAGDRVTIADLSVAGYLFYPEAETGYDFAASHPAIEAWRDRIRSLPGWREPYRLMPPADLPA